MLWNVFLYALTQDEALLENHELNANKTMLPKLIQSTKIISLHTILHFIWNAKCYIPVHWWNINTVTM